MPHGGMLWGAAAYNNGSFPFKNTHVRRVLHRATALPAIGFTTPQPTDVDDADDRHPAVAGSRSSRGR